VDFTAAIMNFQTMRPKKRGVPDFLGGGLEKKVKETT
jgi:hypothetical protein